MLNNKQQKYFIGTKVLNVLYVVMNGLISLIDVGDKGYSAYCLEMGDEHRYLFGNWLLEESIPIRRKKQNAMVASLEGVRHHKRDGLTGELDLSLNAVVKLNKAPSAGDSRVRAVFHLPRPKNIYHFSCGELSSGSLDIDPIEFVNSTAPNYLSAIRVFEYEIIMGSKRPQARLVSGDRSPLWTCPGLATLKESKLRVAALHLYDEPGYAMNHSAGNCHNLREFQLSTQFLGKSGTLLKPPIQPLLPNPVNQPPVPGLLPGEITSLDYRELNVLALIKQIREKHDVPGEVGSGGQVCSGLNGKVTI